MKMSTMFSKCAIKTRIFQSKSKLNKTFCTFSEKKSLAASYFPSDVEPKWINASNGQRNPFYTTKSNAPSFSMLLPPPNVTGSLHIGHALTVFIQDSLVRWKKIKGYDVTWIPGLDHAGIATQSVVEKRLKKTKKLTRHDIGRKSFLEKTFRWKEEHGNRIFDQMKRLGIDIDWEKEFFTMDDVRSVAVNKAFIDLFDANLIYRAHRVINWCPFLKTVLSDIEVEYQETDGPTDISLPNGSIARVGRIFTFLYHVDGMDPLPVSTTRPETIVGDTALAVHPLDDRFLSYHGKCAINPITKSKVPIIQDDILVDPQFGTGVVKVTPAHDFNDYECGLRHDLEFLSIIDENGNLNQNASSFSGLDRFEARDKIIKILEQDNALVSIENHSMKIGKCSRSGDIIEPLLKPQWFLNTKEMARRAVDVVQLKELDIEPSSRILSWNHFLENNRDWCISRQLWWGHRIPIYSIRKSSSDEHTWVAANSLLEAEEKYRKTNSSGDEPLVVIQDDDVLDTWFSSALLPMSAMGWPNNCEDFQKHYPLSLLETGSDILFFWVARMVMLCEYFTGKVPFKKVLLHPIVRDARGMKMSKSLGNVIDPLEIVEGQTLKNLKMRLQSSNLEGNDLHIALRNIQKDFPDGIPECGSDALRLALCSYLEQSSDIKMDVQRVIGYRKFCNKVWQAARFIQVAGTDSSSVNPDSLELFDRWILHKAKSMEQEFDASMESMDFACAVGSVYDFFVHDFCDVYIEVTKPSLKLRKSDGDVKRYILNAVLALWLKTAHPLMPLLTQELCHSLYSDTFLSKQYDVAITSEEQQLVGNILETFQGIRNAIHTHSPGAPKKSLQCFLYTKDPQLSQWIRNNSSITSHLIKYETEILSNPPDTLLGIQISPSTYLYTKSAREGLNPPLTPLKNEKSLKKLMDQKLKLETQMSSLSYAQSVPEHIRMIHTLKLADIQKAIKAFTKP